MTVSRIFERTANSPQDLRDYLADSAKALLVESRLLDKLDRTISVVALMHRNAANALVTRLFAFVFMTADIAIVEMGYDFISYRANLRSSNRFWLRTQTFQVLAKISRCVV